MTDAKRTSHLRGWAGDRVVPTRGLPEGCQGRELDRVLKYVITDRKGEGQGSPGNVGGVREREGEEVRGIEAGRQVTQWWSSMG